MKGWSSFYVDFGHMCIGKRKRHTTFALSSVIDQHNTLYISTKVNVEDCCCLCLDGGICEYRMCVCA